MQVTLVGCFPAVIGMGGHVILCHQLCLALCTREEALALVCHKVIFGKQAQDL